MRSALVAALVAVLALLSLAQVSRAEPPPPLEARDPKVVLAELEKTPKRRAEIATVRWLIEVNGGKSLQAPVGSPLTTLGPWSDNNALLQAERAIGDCQPLDPAASKAAVGLLTEFGVALPDSLRGLALLEQGKNDEAAAVFTAIIESGSGSGSASCPSEHPMYSHRRANRASLALKCVERAAPKKDRSKLEGLLKRARDCAANNHAVG